MTPIAQDAHGNRVMVYLGLRPCRCRHPDGVKGGSSGAICGSTVVAVKAPAVSTDGKYQKQWANLAHVRATAGTGEHQSVNGGEGNAASWS